MRVVSLLPSATELLCEIGAADLLVGRSHECDFPPGIEALPALTSPASREPGRSSPPRVIDSGALTELRPDLVLAGPGADLAFLSDLPGPRPEIITLDPETIDAVLDDLIRIGRAVGREQAAATAAVSLSARLLRAQEHVNAYEEGPVVGFMEWTDPIEIAGRWNVQLIERAGGRHPLNETVADEDAGSAAGLQQGQRRAGRSIAVSRQVFAATQPDWLVIAPRGLDLPSARAEAENLAAQDWFQDLPAVRSGRVAIVDGAAMFNRPGPRLVDAFEWLVGWLQGRPELFPASFPWSPISA